MESDQDLWLDHHAVTCRVFRGRWSIRHCMRIYSDIKDLKINMSSRSSGKVMHYQSAYNPCEHCENLEYYMQISPDATMECNRNSYRFYNQARAL